MCGVYILMLFSCILAYIFISSLKRYLRLGGDSELKVVGIIEGKRQFTDGKEIL